MASTENPAALTTQKKRVESIDAFRGFTIFAMILVIQAAGYKHLPQTLIQFGSAPVSTWKHAGDGGEPREWAYWEFKDENREPTLYRLGKVTGGGRGAYNVAWDDEKGTSQTKSGVNITAAKNLYKDEEIVAVKHDNVGADYSFMGVGNGCTFTDLVAPFFVFIVGVCIPLSKASRGPRWWIHAINRTFLLIFAGVIYISLIFKLSYYWGILQAIGIAYLMGAIMVQFPGWFRWIAIAAIATFHGWATYHIKWWVEFPWMDKTKPFYTIANLFDPKLPGEPLKPLIVHCTPWASISYGLCTIIGTLIGDALTTKDNIKVLKTCLIVGIAFTAAGYILCLLGNPINKDYVSPSYTLFTGGIGALSFLVFYWIIDVWGFRIWARPLNVFGANALLAYFMQPIFRNFSTALGTQPAFNSFPVPNDFFRKTGYHGLMWAFIWTMCLWVIVLICNKKKIFWKL